MSGIHIMDKVSTTDGREGTVISSTILHTLDDGSVWNECQLSIIEKDYTDRMIVEELCESLGTTLKDMRSTNRKREIVNKRQAIMFVLRDRFGWTHRRVGNIFNKDHSTVTHSEGVVRDLLDIKDRTFVRMTKTLHETITHILMTMKR